MAIEIYAKFGHSYADTIGELGCPAKVADRRGILNELWGTGITEFHISAGKACLSSAIGCFEGMPISWSISTVPMRIWRTCRCRRRARSSEQESIPECIAAAADTAAGRMNLGYAGSRPQTLDVEEGLRPDNSGVEGFFDRLKVGFFYRRDWKGVTIEEFSDMLDAYLRWYRDTRRKSDLGYMSPMQYRWILEMAA